MAQSFADYPQILNPECPWTPLREATGLPNVKWCEETLCSWISEPANTWSNVAFLVAAAALSWRTRKDSSRTLRFWGPATFWVGITSLVYHASVAFLTQVFDFFGMYFFFGLILLLNLVRLGALPKDKLFVTLYPLILGLTGVTVLVAKVGLPVQGIIAVMLVGALVTEVMASVRSAGGCQEFGVPTGAAG
ncbi:MAG: ceramidase domain-containing protein [Myxococcota bacterium]